MATVALAAAVVTPPSGGTVIPAILAVEIPAAEIQIWGGNTGGVVIPIPVTVPVTLAAAVP